MGFSRMLGFIVARVNEKDKLYIRIYFYKKKKFALMSFSKSYLFMIFVLFCGMISCNWYGTPGSGLGTNATIEVEGYKTEYRRQYGDTLLFLNPEMQVPDSLDYLINGFEFLALQSFRLTTAPKEIYYIQWEGTGFIEIRMAYNYETENWISYDSTTSIRVKKRFQTEVLEKIDSLIQGSPDKDSAIFISPWVEINKKRKHNNK